MTGKLEQLIADLHLPDEQLQAISRAFEPVFYKAGTLLVSQGQAARYMYFVEGGYMRIFQLQRGEEVTTHINCPPGFMTSYLSFTTGGPSTENLQCITDCHLRRISRSQLDQLLESVPQLKNYYLTLMQQVIGYYDQLLLDKVNLSASDRYLKLMSTQPDILQHVPLKHVASYLGVTQPSLSRLRRSII